MSTIEQGLDQLRLQPLDRFVERALALELEQELVQEWVPVLEQERALVQEQQWVRAPV